MLYRFISLGLLSCVCLAGSALASCEDGDLMAGQAAKDAAKKAGYKCQIAQVSNPKETPSGEDYIVRLACKGKKLAYKVSLEEFEDAVCFVKKVKKVTDTTDTGKVKCPKPGTLINCMPPTNNPYCRAKIRRWVQKYCPGVTYLD